MANVGMVLDEEQSDREVELRLTRMELINELLEVKIEHWQAKLKLLKELEKKK